jgi:transposase
VIFVLLTLSDYPPGSPALTGRPSYHPPVMLKIYIQAVFAHPP